VVVPRMKPVLDSLDEADDPDDHVITFRYELSEEMVAACTTYTRWLEEEEELPDEQLVRSSKKSLMCS